MSGHDWRCARRLRAGMLAAAGAEAAGAPPLLTEVIAARIAGCCGHRALKARRLARGWSVEKAVAAFHAMCGEDELGARGLTARSWLEWEAGGHPRADYQDLLCRLFRADPVSLGFSRAYAGPGAGPAAGRARAGGLPAGVGEVAGRAANDSVARVAAAGLGEAGPLECVEGVLAWPGSGELEGRPLMNGSPRRDEAAVHDDSCAQRIRVLRLAEAGDPALPPVTLLQAIAAEIGSCCGQSLLRAHRLAWGWTVTAALRALRGQRDGGLGHQGISIRAWQDWEAGKRPNRHNQDLLCRLFGTGPVELGFARDYREGGTAGSTGLERAGYTLGKGRSDGSGRRELSPPPAGFAAGSAAQPSRPAQPARPGGLVEWSLVMDAAHESSEHAAAYESASVGPNALEGIGEDVISLARAYLHTPPLSLFGELVRVRDRAYWMLDRTRRLSQQRDLYLVAGQACGLLASASFDLGYPRAAAQQARAARSYGEMIGHKELSAWADHMLSVIEHWAGRPGQALLLAERGLATGPEGTCQVRLWSQVARNAALHGDETRAIEAITASRRARDTGAAPTELFDQVGGEFGFSLPRQAAVYGSTYLDLGRAEEAVAECGQAVELWARAAPEERSFLSQAAARADMAAAHLLRGDLDGAREAVSEVLALDPAKRVESVVRRLGRLRDVLAGPGFQHRAAQAFAEEIEQFTAAPASTGVPTLPS